MNEINVIGATSPLGIDLVRLLADDGYRVRASFRAPERVPELWRYHLSITYEHLDLNDSRELAVFCSKTIVWLAHLGQGRFNDHEVETNLLAFEAFLSEAEVLQVEKIVFVSSGGSVYGEPDELPISEDHPLEPLSSYGKAKAAMERRLHEFATKTGVAAAIIRPGNIYGFTDPNNDHKGIVAAFLNSIQTRTPFTRIHNGKTVRDFIHVDDVSRAIIAAVENKRKHIVWNVATAKGNSIADVIEMIQNQTGLAVPDFIDVENYSSDVNANILAIERITAESDWRPQIDLEEGIAATVKSRLGK
jgi:UDP-glucose 4-epimerase